MSGIVLNTDNSKFYLTQQTVGKITKREDVPVKPKKNRHMGLIVTSAALVSGGIVFALTQKNLLPFAKPIENFLKSLKEKSLFKDAFPKLVSKLEGYVSRSKSLNNIRSIKDIIFMKVMNMTAFTKKIHFGITKIFEKMSLRTVKTYYRALSNKFTKFLNFSNKLDTQLFKNGVDKQAISDISQVKQQIKSELEGNFNETALNSFCNEVKVACEGLEDKVLKTALNGITSLKEITFEAVNGSNVHRRFIAEDILLEDKGRISQNILESRERVENYLEELLKKYKNVLPERDYEKLEKKTESILKKLNQTSNMTVDKLFDKLRDLVLGTAPTDILTILGSTLGVGIALLHADDKKSRQTALLEYGIPVIGSITTSLVCTMALMTGLKAMGIGLASGFVINRIGKVINQYQNNDVKQTAS